MKESPKLSPREEFSQIHSDHRFLERGAQLVVASTKNPPRRARRSGGLGDEIPHKTKKAPGPAPIFFWDSFLCFYGLCGVWE